MRLAVRGQPCSTELLDVSRHEDDEWVTIRSVVAESPGSEFNALEQSIRKAGFLSDVSAKRARAVMRERAIEQTRHAIGLLETTQQLGPLPLPIRLGDGAASNLGQSTKLRLWREGDVYTFDRL
jgi:hypothetical protein